MQTNDHTDILVAGAGPVGMYTALRLAGSGVDVQVIDQESGIAGRSCACALHPRTLQLLDQVGVAREAVKLGHKIDKIALYEGEDRRGPMDLSKLPVKFPFVLVLEQRVLENLLEQKLRKAAGIRVRWNRRLADVAVKRGGVTAAIDELAMDGKGYIVPDFEMTVKNRASTSAEFVVGADGQGSLVRRRMGIEMERAGNREQFVVYELKTEAKLPREIRIVLDRNTASVLWPFGDNQGRWSFQWLPADAPAEFPPKDRTPFVIVDQAGPEDSRHHLQHLLAERAPWFHCGIKEVGWSADIQFEQRLARQFGRGRAWLAGDAAHQTGPIGMQSMNMGFREADDLAGKLALVLREKGSPDLLEAYHREHHAEWQKLLGWDGAVRWGSLTDEWVRGRATRIPACLPATGSELTMLLQQVGLDAEYEPAGRGKEGLMAA